MFESVVFLPRSQMQKMVSDSDTIVISLATPNDPAYFDDGWRGVLQLEFDDVCEEVFGVSAGSIPAEQEHYTHEFGPPKYGMAIYRLPTVRHAKAIVDFLARHENVGYLQVIVHCDQGKSRSAAVARFVADRYDIPILNADPKWQNHVAIIDTSRANPRILRLLHLAGESRRNAPPLSL